MRAVLYSGEAPSGATLLYVGAATVLALGAGRAAFRRFEGELAVVL